MSAIMNKTLHSGERYVAILMTVHNRKNKTVSCLQALQKSMNSLRDKKIKSNLYVFDDGSNDGTATEVHGLWPHATIIRGDGSFFWCRGMNIVWSVAAKSDPDYYLLLNDDTDLYPDALNIMVETTGEPFDRNIGVGLIIDPNTASKSYGGTYYPNEKSIKGEPKRCWRFNANCVLIPRSVYQQVGTFHNSYTHSMGDMDYSHEALRHGIQILETGKAVGTCSRNPIKGTWRDQSLSRVKRFKKLNSKKGLPYSEWWIFCRRNCGKKWLKYFITPTLKIILGR